MGTTKRKYVALSLNNRFRNNFGAPMICVYLRILAIFLVAQTIFIVPLLSSAVKRGSNWINYAIRLKVWEISMLGYCYII